MNGPHDLGGQDGFGPVAPEPNEPTFHAPWERRALGVTLAAGAMGGWTIDESRHARECLRPVDYYSSSYYEIWIKALEVLLRRHGFVSEADLAAGYAGGGDGAGPTLRPTGDRAARLRGWRRGADKGDEPAGPYSPATLCPGQAGTRRDGSGLFRASRHQCAGRGRAAGVGL